MKEYIVPLVAIGKPRMTRRDKWKKRPNVIRYREFCDQLRLHCTNLPSDPYYLEWIAYFPIPESYSKKKAAELVNTIHQVKPDKDNVDKGIMDALFERDQRIAVGAQEKRWDDGYGPRIVIRVE